MTRLLTIIGILAPLTIMFGNESGNPFHDAPLSLRLIGGGILAIVGGCVGFAAGYLFSRK